MNSIRSYLLTRLVGGTALVLCVAGIGVYAFVARSLETQFDRNLSDRVLGFASILFQTQQTLSFEFSDELMPEYDARASADPASADPASAESVSAGSASAASAPAYFQLWLTTGELVERSNSLGDDDLVVPLEATEIPHHWTAPLPDGRTGRYVAQILEVHHVYPEEGPARPVAARVKVVIARGREELVAAESKMLASCAAVALGLLGLIALLTRRAVDRGLEPAERVALKLDAIRVDDLPESHGPDWLGVGELPRELRPVAEKTEALIQRLGAALERERRTTADIAHELRTPISELLTVSEVALRKRNGQVQNGNREALGTIRDVARRMGNSVSTLLRLARLEMGDESFETQLVEPGVLIEDLLRILAPIGAERQVRVDNQVPEETQIQADPEAMRIIFSNLLSNALYYASPGAVVTCRFEQPGPTWVLAVENHAEGMTLADLGSVSAPFWKRDRARTDRDRSGLGLALSVALAQATNMSLSFELEAGLFRAQLTVHE